MSAGIKQENRPAAAIAGPVTGPGNSNDLSASLPRGAGVDRLSYALNQFVHFQRDLGNAVKTLGKAAAMDPENRAATLLRSEGISLTAGVNSIVKSLQSAAATGAPPDQPTMAKATTNSLQVQKFLGRVEKFKASA